MKDIFHLNGAKIGKKIEGTSDEDQVSGFRNSYESHLRYKAFTF